MKKVKAKIIAVLPVDIQVIFGNFSCIYNYSHKFQSGITIRALTLTSMNEQTLIDFLKYNHIKLDY